MELLCSTKGRSYSENADGFTTIQETHILYMFTARVTLLAAGYVGPGAGADEDTNSSTSLYQQHTDYVYTQLLCWCWHLATELKRPIRIRDQDFLFFLSSFFPETEKNQFQLEQKSSKKRKFQKYLTKNLRSSQNIFLLSYWFWMESKFVIWFNFNDRS